MPILYVYSNAISVFPIPPTACITQEHRALRGISCCTLGASSECRSANTPSLPVNLSFRGSVTFVIMSFVVAILPEEMGRIFDKISACLLDCSCTSASRTSFSNSEFAKFSRSFVRRNSLSKAAHLPCNPCIIASVHGLDIDRYGGELFKQSDVALVGLKNFTSPETEVNEPFIHVSQSMMKLWGVEYFRVGVESRQCFGELEEHLACIFEKIGKSHYGLFSGPLDLEDNMNHCMRNVT
jgi:hypothetical protein